jgi:two-component system, OmpR family, sensor histidine kinase MtrB
MFKYWRSSMVLRVTVTIVFFSVVIISLVGSALYTQLQSGIYKEKISASISDAQSIARATQIQLIFSQYQNRTNITKVFSGILSDPTIDGSTSGRDIAVFSSNNLKGPLAFNGTSNSLIGATIPMKFRERNKKSVSTKFTKATLFYKDSPSKNGLIVGHNLTLDGGGKYEFYVVYSFEQQEITMSLVRNALFIAGLVLILLIGLTTLIVTRQLVAPIRGAAELAALIASGDLQQRININRRDEMGRLSKSFNDMTAALQAQILRLENLSKLQQRFVSDVSHELRTPLTTIRMASQVLHSEREKFEPALARSAELLVAQIDRFEALLSDLLEVSRFDAEAAIMELQEVDLTNLLRESIEYVHPNQNRDIELIAPSDPVKVVVDPRRIQRIVRNLVTNAIDHRDEKPVRVTVVATENEAALSVRDFGEGLTEDETKRVFDRFWRKDPARTRTRGSSGLGLSIAKEDAELHKGELEVWARPTQGAHFVLTIPRHPGGVIQSKPIPVTPP